MENSRAMGPLGLAVALSLLAATPAIAQMNPRSDLRLQLDGEDPFTIVLEQPGEGEWRFRLPPIELPDLPREWPRPGGGGADVWPLAFELPVELPNLPDVGRPTTRPSSAVPEPSAALLFGLGAVVAGRASRRGRSTREFDRS